MSSYDIIIIGAGPGRLCRGHPRGQLGFKTAIVEREHLGGICLNWGCIPTKALLRSAEIFHYMQHAKDYGLSAEGRRLRCRRRWSSARAASSAQLNGGVGFLMKKNKIDVIWGEATIDAPGKVAVEGRRSRRAAAARAEGRAGRGHLPGQAHHRRHRRAAARAARASSPTAS